MDSVDRKYAGILSTRLNQFSIINTHPYSANFRCFVCGDSQKSSTKKRGYLHEKSNKLFYYCHNCHYNKPLGIFLKHHMPSLYDEYVIDTKLERDILEKKPVKPLDTLTMARPKFTKKNSPLAKIKKVSQLPVDHPARNYIKSRGIPPNQHYRMYYVSKWKKWINSVIPNKFDSLDYDQPRLVFPLIDKDGNVNGVNGRAFDPKAMRYITIMFNDGAPKMFGLDIVDFSKTYYVVEGPIDSLFLNNSIAMVGADSNISALKNLDNAVFIHDNEPRNEKICDKMEALIKKGRSVVIWPDYLETGLDINDMVKQGLNPREIIKSNTYRGMEAQLMLNTWRKS